MGGNAQKILLIDSSKIEKSSLMTYAELKDFDDVIIDRKPAQKYVDYFKKNNVKLHYDDFSGKI